MRKTCKTTRKKGNRRRTARTPITTTARSVVGATWRATRRLGPACLLGTVLVSAIWLAVDYVRTGPYFRARDVRVDGLRRVTESEVLERARVRRGGTITLGLDAATMARRIEGLPWIASAAVSVTLPDRVRVAVVERRAEVLVMVDRLVLSDGFGNLFAEPTRPEDVDRPVVTGLDAGRLRVGDEAERRRLKVALAASREWERRGLSKLASLSEVHMDPVMGVVLYTGEDGTAIRVGMADMAARLSRLVPVLEDVRRTGRRVEYVLLDDERDPRRVILRTEDRSITEANVESPGEGERRTGRRDG